MPILVLALSCNGSGRMRSVVDAIVTVYRLIDTAASYGNEAVGKQLKEA